MTDSAPKPFLVQVPLVEDAENRGSTAAATRVGTSSDTVNLASSLYSPLSANQAPSLLADRKLTKEEETLLRDVVDHPDDVVKDRLERLDWTAHKILKNRKLLEARGLVISERVSTDFGLVVFVRPTETGIERIARDCEK